ncbi:MAG TPA: choice-of-anchor D domain-containing protein [Candidatus Acidoferrales bacterium]|nr:choice-of-anchor D domain-containing protein [Candidatus Acidoferrales bacterium]
MSSCAAYTSADGPQTQSSKAAKSGFLAMSGNNLSFQGVLKGSSATRSLTITNTGGAPVNISQAAISGAGFTLIGGSPSFSIPVGKNATMQIQFAPQTPGPATGSLSILSDATNAPLSIPISGDGMQAGMAIAPGSLNFGNVIVGQSGTQSVTLTNTGNANLVVNLASVSGSGFSASGLSLPATISAGQRLSFSVQFKPTVAGGISGLVTFADNASSVPQTLALAGSGVAANATLIANPGSVTFGSVAAGSSATQTITLTNSGTTPTTISAASISGTGFTVSGLAASETIQAGQSASFTAKLSPASGGSASGAISITSNAQNSPLTIALSGTGAQGALSSNPSSFNFGTVQAGTSVSQTITLTNTGTASVGVSAASISGTGFSLSALAPQTINPGQGVSFSAQFTPASAGSMSGKITITSNAPGSPMTIALSGTGSQGALSASPSTFNFGSVQVGGTGTQTIRLTNTGTASVTVSSAGISGSGFSISGLPSSQTISAGQSSTFIASFAPTSSGSSSGSIVIASNAPGSSLTIALSGTGTQPQLAVTPSNVSFANVVVGNTNSQTITIKNSGTSNLTISQANTSGTGFGVSGLGLQTPIAPGASVAFNATFTPTSAGSASGSILLTSNAPNSPLTIPLSGTGLTASYALTASPASVPFGSVNVGNSSSQTVTLTNSGNSDSTISAVTVTGTGFSSSGIPANLTLSPNQSATLTVAFTPAASGVVNGKISIASNASSPTTVSLSGTGAQQSHSVVLTWAASTSSGVTGYNIYRGSSSSGPYSLTSSSASGTTFTDTAVQSGQTYYYVVTSIELGVESGYSSPAMAAVR